MRYQVSCINKTNRTSPHERIIRIGGIYGGKRWSCTQKEAISYIESGAHSFFVNVRGNIVDIVVKISALNNKYLTTEADGITQNNLLSLSECPLV